MKKSGDGRIPRRAEGKSTNMDQSEKLLAALLDMSDSCLGVMPWCVSPIHSAGLVFMFDAREDAESLIMAAIACDAGGTVVDEAIHTTREGRSILGLLAKPNGDDLEDYAGQVRTQYLYASGPDPSGLEPPF